VKSAIDSPSNPARIDLAKDHSWHEIANFMAEAILNFNIKSRHLA